MRQNLNRFAGFVLLLAFIVSGLSLPSKAQVRPIYDMGAIGLGQALKRLQTTASAMHTGAHPDDEDSALLSYLARHDQARTVYLSLNRGDGGQNIIGNELFEELGVIRSEELLQARRLDGGQQMFTRVMDYGFSKTIAEAREKWDEKQVLSDMVRGIRTFRPLVVIARFTGTPADGHGQHQLAGYLTPIAFKAAADPTQFPEQIAEGLRPWQAKKLYVGEGFRPGSSNETFLRINTGDYDSLIGRSYFEIAIEGRSQHKSQEMGGLELRGAQTSGEKLLDSKVEKAENEKSVFDGIDTSIKGIAKLTNNSEKPVAQKLAELQDIAASALAKYESLAPQKLVPILAKGVKTAREAGLATKNPDTKFLIEQKEQEFSKALQMALGIVVDTLTESETVVGGDSINVTTRVFAPSMENVKIKEVTLYVPKDWGITKLSPPKETLNQGFRFRRENAQETAYFSVTALKDAKLTQPYWLEKPRQNYEFDWNDESAKNLPFAPPLISSKVKLDIDGTEITISKPAQYRYADDIRGEIRRELNVVPAASINLDADLWVIPAAAKPTGRKVVMSVTNNSPRELNGEAKLNLPSGWTAQPNSANFSLKNKGDKTAVNFDVTIPAKAPVNSYKIGGEITAGGETFRQKTETIEYPHIQTHRIYKNAEIGVQVMDLKVAPVNVGYILGSGDEVPESIKQMGLKVQMLDEKELATGNLSRYDVIVVGVRASQVREDFVANNNRILEYVKNGGTLIVQYQRPDYVARNLQPFPADMRDAQGTTAGTTSRVTDENAKVTILEPNNPVFNFPNKITDADFKGWVQERDLYNFAKFDPQYTPLLESHDAGEVENKGGMVYAKVGKGNYIYNSYSFFRQLPTGVPGAYRIFANLLSLPKARAK